MEYPEAAPDIPGKPFLSYLRRNFVAQDVALNVAAGGVMGETISSRSAKDARRARLTACILCAFLDLFEWDHCEKSIARSVGKLPGQYELPKGKKPCIPGCVLCVWIRTLAMKIHGKPSIHWTDIKS